MPLKMRMVVTPSRRRVGDGSKGERAGCRRARCAMTSARCDVRESSLPMVPRLLRMATVGSPELLIVMGAHATPDQVDEVVARLEEAGAAAHVTPGKQATVIGAIGERDVLAALPLETYGGVDQVLPILKPYKLVSREISPDPTVVSALGRRIGEHYFGFIAGPCTVE